ncbi:hypothetical protein TARUN_9603 [Trichoderma arundinaceum]|uniref:Uncharacterized protein n=1 Tax=Trichoderma arundinaceum TaxID=490622 RepID=A0A395N9H2_TRIAR|nr:hypothetical protein TARUN_9603 [Trichoderma arundinaceum]
MPNEDPTESRKRPRSPESERNTGEGERRKRRATELEERNKSEPLSDSSDDETTKDSIRMCRNSLRRHIGMDGKSEPSDVMFFIEKTPSSSQRGSACCLTVCEEKIREGVYRIAVYPGNYSSYRSADFYHVECFEKLADFSNSEFLHRLQPVTRNTFSMRNLKATSISNGNFVVDGGAERLILEWKSSMARLIARRDGTAEEVLTSSFRDLLYKSGSASFKPERVEGMMDSEYFLLCHSLAPIESDGAEDDDEWNLFENYVPLNFENEKDLDETHSLSLMLGMWGRDKFLARRDEEHLTEKGKEVKKELGEKGIRAIRRLSALPMPDFRSAFLAGANFGNGSGW